MAEFEINGRTYRSSLMPPKVAFRVVRRILPVMAALVAKAEPGKKVDIANVVLPLGMALGEMSDANADYVLDTLLGAVQLQATGGKWGPVIASNGVLMNQEIDLAEMIEIAAEVFKENLAGFFAAMQSRLPKDQESPD